MPTDSLYVQGVEFKAAKKTLTIIIDFVADSRFAHPEAAGLHPVHDTQVKRYRHLNFFQRIGRDSCRKQIGLPNASGPSSSPDGRIVVALPARDLGGQLSRIIADRR